ncbi:Protein O-Glucosyltransferase/Glycosyltransferase 90 [Pleurotus pulmonarius]|nr:capsule-associated protein CAP1 [Pleurotus pulmonarius]
MPLTQQQSVLGFVSQRRGTIFLICVFIAFMQAGLFSGHWSHKHLDAYPDQIIEESYWGSQAAKFLRLAESTKTVVKEHPIPKLMDQAEARFREKVDRQSKTLQAAVKEYKRRYERNPPKGFDEWWKFAKANNVTFVDEYDGLVADLAPFWSLSGVELRRRTEQVGQLPSIDLLRLEKGKTTVIKNDDFRDSEAMARAHGFRRMIERFQDKLPDMSFPINAKAEGRVLVPWEHQKYPNLTKQDSSGGIEDMLGGPFPADWRGNGNVWEAWRRTCPPSSPARRLFASVRNTFTRKVPNYLAANHTSPGNDFSFVPATATRFDFCEKPHAHYTQGHFFSDWRTIPVLYPVFSPATTAGYLDIRIPSHYYYGSTKRYTYGWDPVNMVLKEVDDMEQPWEAKIDKIFWRGASTGGGSHPPGFSHQYQRHRFLRMTSDTSDTNRTITFEDPPGSKNFVSAVVPLAKLNEEIMDVAFVKITDAQNYPGGLPAMQQHHRMADSVPLGRHWAYKYLIDMDGMGYSGRFMSFLASDSAALKATIYEEYYSDWIEPWVHFIPLSNSYREIYNIYAYFSGPTNSTIQAVNGTQTHADPNSDDSPPPEPRPSVEGNRRLRRIARAGKQWKKTIGRTIDMEVYVYRLCLEWARLFADDRDSMDFNL